MGTGCRETAARKITALSEEDVGKVLNFMAEMEAEERLRGQGKAECPAAARGGRQGG